MTQTVLETQLDNLTLWKRGKVRDVYDLGEHLLIAASDRISAFDVVIPTGIPQKGNVLTQLSAFWFSMMKEQIPSHFISAEIDPITQRYSSLGRYRDLLAHRSMLVRKSQAVPIECVVRGYLSGSGWKEYKQSQSICGVRLPSGLVESQELQDPIFTPATKEESGHDINISETDMAQRVGEKLTQQLKTTSLAIYKKSRDYAKARGILIADTKFEFGLLNGAVLLIDELLTPDSSRFWPLEGYAAGGPCPSFDKQFVRDYLESLKWDKKPPAPPLPSEIVEKTSEKYLQAYAQLTGKDPDVLFGKPRSP